MTKIDPKMTKINPKMLKIRHIDPKISKTCVSYCKIPTQDKNHVTSPLNPTAGPQTYWEAPSQLPTQFPPLQVSQMSRAYLVPLPP